MVNIRLCKMTKPLCRAFLKDFTNDPDIFMDMNPFSAYQYSQQRSDAYWQRHQDLGRVHLAVMLGDDPIGEIVLKNFDKKQRCCTMGIHLQNDSVKYRGYGTQAEILTLRYAFDELNLNTVYADAILKNQRSQHVLQKVGFRKTHEDDQFCYYRCDRTEWIPPECSSDMTIEPEYSKIQ